MAYKYTDQDIERISGRSLVFGEPMNRYNCKHLPELVRNAETQLQKAKKSGSSKAIIEAQEILEERTEKLNAYRKGISGFIQIKKLWERIQKYSGLTLHGTWPGDVKRLMMIANFVTCSAEV